MNPSTKKTLIYVLIVLVAAIVIGVIAWSSRPAETPASVSTTGTPSGVTTTTTTSTAPSATASSSISAQASSTGGLTVKVSPIVPSATSTSWESYTAKTVKVAFSVPPGWAPGPNIPISIDNFNHQYQGDSIIPPGGAEIDIVSTNYSGLLADLIKTETMSGTVNATSTVSVEGVSCAKVMYSSSYASGYPSSNVAVYCQDAANGLLYKFYLSYPSGDSKGTQDLAVFGQFLGKVQFTQ